MTKHFDVSEVKHTCFLVIAQDVIQNLTLSQKLQLDSVWL